jgi:uncharacterized membrane protein (DUF373 family)
MDIKECIMEILMFLISVELYTTAGPSTTSRNVHSITTKSMVLAWVIITVELCTTVEPSTASRNAHSITTKLLKIV